MIRKRWREAAMGVPYVRRRWQWNHRPKWNESVRWLWWSRLHDDDDPNININTIFIWYSGWLRACTRCLGPMVKEEQRKSLQRWTSDHQIHNHNYNLNWYWNNPQDSWSPFEADISGIPLLQHCPSLYVFQILIAGTQTVQWQKVISPSISLFLNKKEAKKTPCLPCSFNQEIRISY